MASSIVPSEIKQVDGSSKYGARISKSTDKTHESYAKAVSLGKSEVTYSAEEKEPSKSSCKLHTQAKVSSAVQTEAALLDKGTAGSLKTKGKKKSTERDGVKSGETTATQVSDTATKSKRQLKRDAKKSRESTADKKEQDDTRNVESTRKSDLTLTAAERRKIQKVARKAKVKAKAADKKTLPGDTSSQTNKGLCAETSRLSLSIEEQRKQELHTRLDTLIKSKRQISLATNNQQVRTLLFPEPLDLSQLELTYEDFQDLLLKAKKIFFGEARPFKDDSVFLSDLIRFKTVTLDITKTHKETQAALFKTMLNDGLKTKLHNVLKSSAEARITYESILFKHWTILDALSLFLQLIDDYDVTQNLNSDKAIDTGKITEPSQITQYFFKSQTELSANLCWCLNAMDEIRKAANFSRKTSIGCGETLQNLDDQIVKQYQRHLEKCIARNQFCCSKVEQCADYEEKKTELNKILLSQLDIFTSFKGACLSHDSQHTQFTKQQLVEIIKVNYDICIIHFTTWNLFMLPSAIETLDAGFTYLQKCLCANTSGAVTSSSAAVQPYVDMAILSTHLNFFTSKFKMLECFLTKAKHKFNVQSAPKPEVSASDEIQQERLMFHNVTKCITASFESGFFKWMSSIIKEDAKEIIKEAEKQEILVQLSLQLAELKLNNTKMTIEGFLKTININSSPEIGELIEKLNRSIGFTPNEVDSYVEQLESHLKKEQTEPQNLSEPKKQEDCKNKLMLINAVKQLLADYNRFEQSRQRGLNCAEKAKQLKIKTECCKSTSEIIEEFKQDIDLLTEELDVLNKQHEKLKKELEYELNQHTKTKLHELMQEIEQEAKQSKSVVPLPQPRPASPENDDEHSMNKASTIELVKPEDTTKEPSSVNVAYESVTIEQLTILSNQKKWGEFLSVLKQDPQFKNKYDTNKSSDLITLMKQSIVEMNSEQHTHCQLSIEFNLFIIEYVFDISYELIIKMISYSRLIIRYNNQLNDISSSNKPKKNEGKIVTHLIKELPEQFSYLEWIESVGLPEAENSLTSVCELINALPTNSSYDVECCFSLLSKKMEDMKPKLEQAKGWQSLNFEQLYQKRGEYIESIKKSKGNDNKTSPENKTPFLTKANIDKAQKRNLSITCFIQKISSSVDSCLTFIGSSGK